VSTFEVETAAQCHECQFRALEKHMWIGLLEDERILSYRTKGVREACELYTHWQELARSLWGSSRALAAGRELAARRVPRAASTVTHSNMCCDQESSW
jgi:hypothetical protein